MENKSKLVNGFIIGTFVSLYLMVSVISTIHVIDFFKLSNPNWLAISLAIAFEIGAAASLASLIALKKMNKGLVWMLFFLLTAMQAMGNTYYAYVNLDDFQAWIELFGLVDEEIIFQKRVLSIVSGAILPIVALGFIKSLVDYIKPEEEIEVDNKTSEEETPIVIDSRDEMETKLENELEEEKDVEEERVEIAKNLDGGNSIEEVKPEIVNISEPLITNFNAATDMITDQVQTLEDGEEINEVPLSLTDEEAEAIINTGNDSEEHEVDNNGEVLNHNGSSVKIQEKIRIKSPKQPIIEIPESDPTRM